MTIADQLCASNPSPMGNTDGIAILRQHEPWLRRVLWNRLGDREAVDDIMQEIGLAVSRPQQGPQDASKFPAWLYQVAVRQAYQYRRRLGRYRKLVTRISEQRTPALLGTDNADPLSWLLGSERQQAVQQAIQQLSPTDREILLLKYSENWTYQQLADRLGVTVHTIEHRLLKAKKKLRQLLHAVHVEV